MPDLLVHASVTVQVWEAEADVVPVWRDALAGVARVRVHADVVKGVWPAQPANIENNGMSVVVSRSY